MQRYIIQRKICDTLFGGTYECVRRPPGAAPVPRRPTAIVIKCSHLSRASDDSSTSMSCSSISSPDSSPLESNTLGEASRQPAVNDSVDDPMQECLVVEKLIASGGHNNVLQCYDTFVTNDNIACVVSELCGDGDLFQYLSSAPDHAVPQAEAVALVLQVTRGLQFLKSVGFAHRDVSLENVLLRGGTCKLADFGAAIAVGTRCTDRVGKSQYMAPEVVSASAESWYDPSLADVWSLGVMLFILVTGSPLVCVASEEDPRYVALLRYGVGAILSSWGVEVSTELESLLSSMLKTDPTKRVGLDALEVMLVHA